MVWLRAFRWANVLVHYAEKRKCNASPVGSLGTGAGCRSVRNTPSQSLNTSLDWNEEACGIYGNTLLQDHPYHHSFLLC